MWALPSLHVSVQAGGAGAAEGPPFVTTGLAEKREAVCQEMTLCKPKKKKKSKAKKATKNEL